MPLYTRTCRQEILDAMVRLERRHDRSAFSPSEIVAEVASRGIGHAEEVVPEVVELEVAVLRLRPAGW